MIKINPFTIRLKNKNIEALANQAKPFQIIANCYALGMTFA